MIKTISNPQAPASPKQTFAVFCKSGYDVRGCNLTMQQASDILDGKLDPGTLPGAVQKRKAAAPKQDFAAIHAEADAAGMAAGQSCIPVPMVVVQRANPLDDSSPVVKAYEPVMDGVCGFAAVVVSGLSPFGKWAKKQGIMRPHYPKGLSLWIGAFNQSMTRKEAYAEGYVKVLRLHGIEAYSWSRMD